MGPKIYRLSENESFGLRSDIIVYFSKRREYRSIIKRCRGAVDEEIGEEE